MSIHSDHDPFYEQGFDVIFISNEQNHFNHTQKDAIDKVDVSKLDEITRLILEILLQYSKK